MAKKELSISEFREIVREEALKLKKRLTLENEKRALENELKQLISENYMEEIPCEEAIQEVSMEEAAVEEGLFNSSYKKAKTDFQNAHQAEINQMLQAYKAYDPSYIDLSTALINKAKTEYLALAKKYGINAQDAYNVLWKDIMTLVQPMDFGTFKSQAAKGGASFSDVAAGSAAGRQGWTGNK